MHGGRNFQRGDIWGDGDGGNPAHMTADWKIAESDELTVKPERKLTEDEAEEECVAVAGGHMTEGKPLILLQVNCRSICNKILEFWNLIDT